MRGFISGAGGGDSWGQLLLLFYDLLLWIFANVHKSKKINMISPLYSPPSINHYQCMVHPASPTSSPPDYSNRWFLPQSVFNQHNTQLPSGLCSLPCAPQVFTWKPSKCSTNPKTYDLHNWVFQFENRVGRQRSRYGAAPGLSILRGCLLLEALLQEKE